MSQTDIPTGSITTIRQYWCMMLTNKPYRVVNFKCLQLNIQWSAVIAILLRELSISTHKDKENCQHQQANKAHERQEKAHQKASKAAEHEAYQNGHTHQYISIFVFFVLSHSLSNIIQQVSVASGNDPGFASQIVSTPARDPNLVPRKSTVPHAPHRVTLNKTPRLNTLTPEKAAELLRLREAVLVNQAMSPVAVRSRDHFARFPPSW
ncbi:hypothetical protein EDB19DRAFT_1833966 [Suillus lakei]|nr:hypothetical protein EDB19DRAFT_1833966 [Suillus lakei]